jgi:enoyl-CoA hydratase/carnithine racemase
LQAALEMILTGKPITPIDAKSIGLVSALGDREQLIALGRTQLTYLNVRGDWRTRRLNEQATPTTNTQDRNLVFEWERKLVGKPAAILAALAVVRDGWSLPLPAGLDRERAEFARVLKTPEAREGVVEFLNRKKTPRPSA